MSPRRINAVRRQSLLTRRPPSLDHNPFSLNFHKNTHRVMEPHRVLASHVVFINTHCHRHAAMEQPHIQHLKRKALSRPPLKQYFLPFIYLHMYSIFRIIKQNTWTTPCTVYFCLYAFCILMCVCVCLSVNDSMPVCVLISSSSSLCSFQ